MGRAALSPMVTPSPDVGGQILTPIAENDTGVEFLVEGKGLATYDAHTLLSLVGDIRCREPSAPSAR